MSGGKRMTAAARTLSLAAAVAALAGCGGSSTGSPSSLRVAWNLPVNAHIDDIAVGDGAVWLATEGSLLRLDPASGRVVRKIPIPGTAGVVGVGAAGVWVATLSSDKQSSSLFRIDPTSNQVVAEGSDFTPGEVSSISVGATGVWVSEDLNGGEVDEVDPANDRMVGSPITVDQAGTSDLEGGTLWVSQGMGASVTRIDTSTRRATKVSVGGENVGALVAFGNGVWVGSDATDILQGHAQVVRVQGSAATQHVGTPGETTVQGLASAFGRVWVLTLDGNGKLRSLDPGAGSLTGQATNFQAAQAVNVVSGANALWVFTTDNHLFKLIPG